MKLIFTHRPKNGSFISVINAITRRETESPYDHVALLYDGFVYESTAGPGVRQISFYNWKTGREGTWLYIFDIPDGSFDINTYHSLEGRKYDYKANLWFLLGYKSGLKKHSTDELFCSELIVEAMKNFLKQELGESFKKSYLWTPCMIAKFCMERNYPLKSIVI